VKKEGVYLNCCSNSKEKGWEKTG